MSPDMRAREAALLVHSLPEDARGQVLERLSADEIAQVRPLLAELTALGIPKLAYDTVSSSRAAPQDADLMQSVSGLQPEQVVTALSQCGVATVAQLLSMAEWPWKPAVLERLEAGRHERLLALASSPPPAPRVAELLCRKILAEAAVAPRSAPASPPRSALRRLLSWIQ